MLVEALSKQLKSRALACLRAGSAAAHNFRGPSRFEFEDAWESSEGTVGRKIIEAFVEAYREASLKLKFASTKVTAYKIFLSLSKPFTRSVMAFLILSIEQKGTWSQP